MITICFTYFKSLSLAHFQAALYSISRQDLRDVKELIIVDNDTGDSIETMESILADLKLSIPYRLYSYRHSDPVKTHAWSTNAAVYEVVTPWVLFSRADYILDFNLLSSFTEVVRQRGEDWHGFVTGNVYHLNVDIARCEEAQWRQYGPQILRALPGREETYMHIDAGVWLSRKDTFDRVGGLDERLTAWGHAQTQFQFQLHQSGVEFHRIPLPLFFHPQHAAERDLAVAHEQLASIGVKPRDLWARYEGPKPY